MKPIKDIARSILCFDPGNTTGWVWVTRDELDAPWDIQDSGDFEHEHPNAINIVEELIDEDVDHVIYERIRPFRAAIRVEGIEVIGWIQSRCKRRKIEYLAREPSHLAGPRNWRITLPQEFKRHSARHQRDALYHLISYLGVDHIADVDWDD